MSGSEPVKIGLVGDHDPAIVAHQAIPQALAMAAEALGLPRRTLAYKMTRLGIRSK